jgi:hypothetical protein
MYNSPSFVRKANLLVPHMITTPLLSLILWNQVSSRPQLTVIVVVPTNCYRGGGSSLGAAATLVIHTRGWFPTSGYRLVRTLTSSTCFIKQGS